jgi:glycosyltransferase involved in cell wall biosynthesis
LKPIPILFLSDNPALPTGLARITKDLAVHVASLPEFRVGTLGRGGVSSSKLPFFNVAFDEAYQWGENYIEDVWNDFAGSQEGVLMTVWDMSRLGWFARPRMGGRLQEFLESKRFKKWAYVPVDHYGVAGKMTTECADTLRGFDRILAYTMFGKQVIEDTLGVEDVDWIPHGINGDVFQPRDKVPGRMALGVKPDELLIGCVMTNQERKDWGTAFAAMAQLKTTGRRFWVHTDVPIRAWNMYALAQDFGMGNSIVFTFNGEYSSEELSYLYSACDISFLPSLGEGFGYPIIESLACGVPVVHGNYGGGVELIPERDWLVSSVSTRLDGPWNCVRPVWNPQDWAKKLEWALTQYGDGSYRDTCTNAVSHLTWKNLWPAAWKKWFLDGIA